MRYFNVPVSAQMQRLPAYVLQVGGHGSQKPVYREKGSLNWHIFFTVSGEGQFVSDNLNCKLSEDNFIIMKANILPELLTMNGFILLLAGGVAYTIGAVIYGLGKKHKYAHSIFHLFILIGSVLQFLCILLYVM